MALKCKLHKPEINHKYHRTFHATIFFAYVVINLIESSVI